MSFIVVDQDFAWHVADAPALRVRHLCVYPIGTEMPSWLRDMSPTMSAAATQLLESSVLQGWGDLIAPAVVPQPIPPEPPPEEEPV